MHYNKTKNYDQFKLIDENRTIRPTRVASLVAEIRKNNKLATQPIICTPDMTVVDGQHRLMAAKQLGVEIYYIIDKDAKIEDMITLNCQRTNWSTTDYILHHVKLGNRDFQKIIEWQEYTTSFGMPVSNFHYCLQILDKNGSNSLFYNDLRKGRYELKNTRLVNNFLLNFCDAAYNLNLKIKSQNKKICKNLCYKNAYVSNFVYFYKTLTEKEWLDLWEALNARYDLLTDSNSVTEVGAMILNLFNLRKRKKLTWDDLEARIKKK